MPGSAGGPASQGVKMSKAAPVTSADRMSPLFDKCFRYDEANGVKRAGV